MVIRSVNQFISLFVSLVDHYFSSSVHLFIKLSVYQFIISSSIDQFINSPSVYHRSVQQCSSSSVYQFIITSIHHNFLSSWLVHQLISSSLCKFIISSSIHQFINHFIISLVHVWGVWKIAKNQNHLVKFGCGNPGILVTFWTGQEFLRKPPHFQYI